MFKQYKRTAIAEMASWTPDFDMTGVSTSSEDLKNGSPKIGDMIARNPKNHKDMWLVAEAYFKDNFEEIKKGENTKKEIKKVKPITISEVRDLLEDYFDTTFERNHNSRYSFTDVIDKNTMIMIDVSKYIKTPLSVEFYYNKMIKNKENTNVAYSQAVKTKQDVINFLNHVKKLKNNIGLIYDTFLEYKGRKRK